MKPLPAFTLMELIIALLLTVIVMGTTFSIFKIVTRSDQAYSKKNESLAAIHQLNTLLERDFGRAEKIIYADSVVTLNIKGVPTIYEIHSGTIVRKSAGIDTFRCFPSGTSASFENQPPVLLIDDLSFTLQEGDQKIPYHYHKTYSSAELINYYANH